MIRLKMRNYNMKYLTGEEILPSNQKQTIEQVNFTYSLLGKAFEKQTKTIKEQGKEQVKSIKSNNANAHS